MVKQKLVQIINRNEWMVQSKKGKNYAISVTDELAEKVDYDKVDNIIKEQGWVWCDVAFTRDRGAILPFVDYNYTLPEHLSKEKGYKEHPSDEPSNKCPECSNITPIEAEFCPECGLELKLKCSNCNTEITDDYKFCIKCGQML